MNMTIRKILVIIAMLAVAVSFYPTDTYASSKAVKSTTYSNTLKSGNYVYCTNAHRLFKVDLKKKTVKVMATQKAGYITCMKIRKGYLYYAEMSQYGAECLIYRINLKTGKKATLARNTSGDYAIKGKKIYYNHAQVINNDIKYKKRVMKLNGKSKKSTKYKVKMKTKMSNASGYLVVDDYDSDYYNDWTNETVNYYLKTPNGYIFLENFYLVI